MKKNLLFLVLLTMALCAYAQDIIVKKDGTPILSKVLEVNTDNVKYKKHSNLAGPTYTISITDILSLTYANGDKEDFGNTPTTPSATNSSSNARSTTDISQGYIKLPADARNEEIIRQYNTIYQPTGNVKSNNKPAKNCIAIIGVKKKSIMSNKDIEMNIIRGIDYTRGGDKIQAYCLFLTNKSDKTVYIDKGNCFRIYNNGRSYCYYENPTHTTISEGTGLGTSLALGGVANVLGIGGVLGQLANSTVVSAGTNSSVSTTYLPQRIIAIPPHGTRSFSADSYHQSKDGVRFMRRSSESLQNGFEYICIDDEVDEDSNTYGLSRGVVLNGQTKVFEEDELPWKQEYYITYSTEEDFKTYSTLYVELYIHEIIGGAGNWNSELKHFKNIINPNEYTLNRDIQLRLPR